MSVFTKSLTNKGVALQAKAQAGSELRYTRFVIGDGRLSGQLLPTMTNVISSKKTIPVTKLRMRPPNEAIVGFTLSNQDVTSGFYFRELGLFAMDPEEGEILYLYANAGETADYIPLAGSDDVIQKSFDTLAFVGQAQNVTANIDHSLVYVTHPELAEAIAGVDIEVVDSVTSTDKTKPGSANAVKTAYDKGKEGLSAAETVQENLTAHSTDYVKHPADGGTTGGTATAYTASSNPNPAALVDKIGIVLTAHVDSGANPTLKWGSLTAYPMLKANGSAAKIKKDGIYTWRFNAKKLAFILQGDGGSGDAIASDLLSGKKASTDAGDIVGTMPDNGSVGLKELTTQNQVYNIPRGFHDGSGSVKSTYVERKYFSGFYAGNDRNLTVDFGFTANVVIINNSYGSSLTAFKDYRENYVTMGGGNYMGFLTYPTYFTGAGIKNFYLYINGGTYHVEAWQ